MFDQAQFNLLSLQQKSELFLAVANFAYQQLDDEPKRIYAKQAIDMMVRWVQYQDVSGDNLYDFLENNDDTGLIFLGCEFTEGSQKLWFWNMMIVALMFVIRESYRLSQEVYLPQTIESLDDEYIFSYLKECFAMSHQDDVLKIIFKKLL